MVFYLQDVSDGRPLTPEHTLATVLVRTVQKPPRPPTASPGSPRQPTTGPRKRARSKAEVTA
jgi:hypothetical protein